MTSVSVLPWLARTWRPVSRSRPLARRLFNVRFPDLGQGDQYFDVTTPLLVRAAARRLDAQRRLLDMGTGAFAVIGLALWRRTGCQVVSTDIHPRILEQARANVALNGAPIRVARSRFFDELDEEFDVVTFNPPYVPSALARDPTYARPFDFQSDGGPEGASVIEAFCDAFAAKGGGATAYLGMNELFVSGAKVRELLRARKTLVLEGIDRLLHLPFYVLEIKRATSPSGVAPVPSPVV
jgi:methylase of polypeptide subunit release factors